MKKIKTKLKIKPEIKACARGVKHNSKHRFAKGFSGNPNGRPKTPESIKKLKDMTLSNILSVTKDLLKIDLQTLDELRADITQPVLVHTIAAILRHSIYEGDSHRLDMVLNRLFGKVPDKIIERKETAPTLNFVPYVKKENKCVKKLI